MGHHADPARRLQENMAPDALHVALMLLLLALEGAPSMQVLLPAAAADAKACDCAFCISLWRGMYAPALTATLLKW